MKLFEKLANTKIEREVEDCYNEEIQKFYKGFISHPYACDGLIGKDKIKLLIEYKYDYDMMSKTSRGTVIVQTIFYLKKFELNGEKIPNIILYADKNECFVLHSNCLHKYLSEDVDWSIAPSQAHLKYVDLVLKIAEDENINPFVFDVNESFDFKFVVDKIEDMSKNIINFVHITEHNIQKVYNICKSKVYSDRNKLISYDIVSLFINTLINRDEYYLHPNKKNCLVTPKGNFVVKSDNFNAFFSHFEKNYTPLEKTKFTEIADRLIEDEKRRRSGDFWTPSIFVDYSHKRISKFLGENWKDEYVVWDVCCGGKNLTRDYNFKEFYCSTLFQSELDIAERYNRGSIAFQFDFLNDNLDKIPTELMESLKSNKKIVFFFNPPYATACNMGTKKGGTKGSICKTMVNKMMEDEDIGGCKDNLLTQFIYRIMKIKEMFNLKNCVLAFFCNPIFISSGHYKKFRNKLLNTFEYKDGYLFNASHFSGCSDRWGISFSIWETKDFQN